jgi:hypothetical protein
MSGGSGWKGFFQLARMYLTGVERKVGPWSFLDCSAPSFWFDVRGNLLDGLSGKYSPTLSLLFR